MQRTNRRLRKPELSWCFDSHFCGTKIFSRVLGSWLASQAPAILFRCRSELPWLPAVLALSLPGWGITLAWCLLCVSGWAHPGCPCVEAPAVPAVPLTPLLPSRPLLVSPAPLPVFQLTCFPFILWALTPSQGYLWSFLLSWHHIETPSSWKPPFLLATEFFRGALGTPNKSDMTGVLPSSGHTSLHRLKCCKKGPHCFSTAVFKSSGWKTLLAGNFLWFFSVLKVWNMACTPRNDLRLCRLWYFMSYWMSLYWILAGKVFT